MFQMYSFVTLHVHRYKTNGWYMIQVPVNCYNRINLQNLYWLTIGSYWSMIGHLYATPVNAQSLICACIVINVFVEILSTTAEFESKIR